LGQLYFNNKSYDQAEEIYIYLIKLSAISDSGGEAKSKKLEDAENNLLDTLTVNAKIAVYYDDLAQIYEITGKADKTLDCYLKANMIEPNNPKYLDKIIKLSIELGDKSLAKKTFNRLRQINPENGKLEDLETAIENI
jgi:tetratricopeptide (TPR) repeat protein